jgi:hypothetical protein
MRWIGAPVLVIALLVTGCSAVRSTREEMRAQMERARSAEASGDLPGAARAYALAAEQFPGGEFFPIAVRKAAILSSHPLNPSRNDSVALAWFRVLAAQPIPGSEKELVALQIATLERSQGLIEQIRRQREAGDSLTAVTRRLSLTAANQSHQLQELESEVKRVSEELRQLKEIDVRLSRRKR